MTSSPNLQPAIGRLPIVGPIAKQVYRSLKGRSPSSSSSSYRGARSAGFESERGPAEVPANVKVAVVGSFTDADLPADLSSFVKNGVCIDWRNNTPMEMDAYSLYLGLKASEELLGRSMRTERQTLVEAVLQRMNDCGGFWIHGAWSGSQREIHMRFTAAAIRLMIEAHLDGFDISVPQIASALKRHLEFAEQLPGGLWFLHDSFEVAGTDLVHPFHPIKNTAFGSAVENCVVLNTHLDTLVTIMHALRRVNFIDPDKQFFLDQLDAGVSALRAVLRPATGLSWRLFDQVDCVARHRLFSTFRSRTFVNRALRRLLIDIYFPLRQRIRSLMPAFVFKDGYIERDISLVGIGFEYHLVNISDLSRFVAEAVQSGFVQDTKLIDDCGSLIDQGLEYCVRGSYWHYLMAKTTENTRSILLCETIIARLACREQPVPQHWVRAYCDIRRALPPSPALLGYDPVICTKGRAEKQTATADVVTMFNGVQLTADYETGVFSFQ